MLATQPTYAGLPAPRPYCRLAFVVQIGTRGTSIASFDFADFSDQLKIASRPPLILYHTRFARDVVSPELLDAYRTRFGNESVVQLQTTVGSSNWLDKLLVRENITHVHMMMARHSIGSMVYPRNLPHVKVCSHLIFEGHRRVPPDHPGGAMTAKISVALAPGGIRTAFDSPVVPLIVRDASPHDGHQPPWTLDGPNLRSELGISQDATVFCRHGGSTSFNVPATAKALKHVASLRSDIHFLLLNTFNLIRAHTQFNFTAEWPNLRFLPMAKDRSFLPRFIRSCDAMIHGRLNGENFGLAVADFGVLQKPVITCASASARNAKTADVGNFHILALGDKAFVYPINDAKALIQTLLSFDRKRAAAQGAYWNAWMPYSPVPVMRSFECVFLRGGRCARKELPPPEGWPEAADGDPCASCSDYASPWAKASE